jgi:MraZ protein
MPFGEFPYAVDDKGRVIIPPPFREFVEDGMVVTRGLERCLYVFPVATWKRLEDQLNNLPVTDAPSRKFTRYFYSGAAKAKIDAAGRITLPSTLRTFAGLDTSVMIAGTPNHLEIWDADLWNATIGELQSDLPSPELLQGMSV